jgi:hypothetical protein
VAAAIKIKIDQKKYQYEPDSTSQKQQIIDTVCYLSQLVETSILWRKPPQTSQ